MTLWPRKKPEPDERVRANLRATDRLERALRILEAGHESAAGLEASEARLVQRVINTSLNDLRAGGAYAVGIRKLDESLTRQRAIRERRGGVAW